jgi:hypothetical protein
MGFGAGDETGTADALTFSNRGRHDVESGGNRYSIRFEGLWRDNCCTRHQLEDSGWIILLLPRPIGLREDLDAPHDRRP